VKQNKSCRTCLKGIPLSINDDILCYKKGVVSSDYVCSKYKPNYFAKQTRQDGNKCIDCINFILDDQISGQSSTIGLCQLFSVRTFDGTRKNACSKFVKKEQREVS